MTTDTELLTEMTRIPASIKTALSLSALAIMAMIFLLYNIVASNRIQFMKEPSFVILNALVFVGIFFLCAFSIWSERKKEQKIQQKKQDIQTWQRISPLTPLVDLLIPSETSLQEYPRTTSESFF